MTLCRAWRHDVCTEPQDCDCWCHEARRRRTGERVPEPRNPTAKEAS